MFDALDPGEYLFYTKQDILCFRSNVLTVPVASLTFSTSRFVHIGLSYLIQITGQTMSVWSRQSPVVLTWLVSVLLQILFI